MRKFRTEPPPHSPEDLERVKQRVRQTGDITVKIDKRQWDILKDLVDARGIPDSMDQQPTDKELVDISDQLMLAIGWDGYK